MDQPRLGGRVNRRRFLKTAAAGAAVTAWSLKHPARASAAVRSDRARAAEANPKRGGVLKWAGPAEVAHFDVHQGAFRFVLWQMYNNLDLRKVIAPGTGAFMFKERKVAEKWVMVRNPGYWDPEIPYLDGIELLHIPAWTDRGTAVLTGQADYSPNVSLETHQEGLKRKDIVGTVRYPGEFNSYQVHINNERKPFNDARVRRAINLAVSRQTLIQAFRTQEPIMLTRWMTHASEFASPMKELECLPGYRSDNTADLA